MNTPTSVYYHPQCATREFQKRSKYLAAEAIIDVPAEIGNVQGDPTARFTQLGPRPPSRAVTRQNCTPAAYAGSINVTTASSRVNTDACAGTRKGANSLQIISHTALSNITALIVSTHYLHNNHCTAKVGERLLEQVAGQSEPQIAMRYTRWCGARSSCALFAHNSCRCVNGYMG